MGILDDAIREHLDLKRRQGADQDELARLEDEAFGPPTRPGEPDFERPDGAQGEAPATAAATEAPAFHDESAGDETELLEGGFDDELAIGEVQVVTDDGDTDSSEHDALAVAGEETEAHDTLGEGPESEEIDLDIELQIDDEIEDVGGLDLEEGEEPEGEEPEAEVAAPPESSDDEPVESLDTVEHHFDDALDEAEVVEGEPEAPADDSDDEDVLEETPEFLRDAPEDDELWFEQGEPKDFDF